MIWSKSKKAIDQLLADSVKDHVDFHMTRYGPGVSYIKARAWITWDGKEITHMSNTDQGWLTRDQFEKGIELYLGQSIDKSLNSDHPITRALALFDRRIGIRRLAKFQPVASEHPLIHLFYDLRCKAEGLVLASDLRNGDLT